MDIIKIIFIAVLCAIICLIIKSFKPEFLPLIQISSLIMIFTMVYGIIKQLLSTVLSIISETNVIYDDYIFLLLKISGIAFITQIGTDVCKDAGSAVLATGVEFAGKVVIITLCIPLLRGVVEMAAALVR